MATWIAHLRVAEGLLALLPHLDEAAFMYGNLAPDSGKPNADWTAFDPPKEITHFLRRGEDEDKIHDLTFYRRYVAAYTPDENRADYSFRLGYFAHLVCDNLWSRRFTPTYKRLYPELETDAKSEWIGIIKRDWYHLDFCYLRDHPDCIFWRVFVPVPNPPPYLDFIPYESLTHSLDDIRGFYSTPNPQRDIDHPYVHLNAAMMSRYVADTITLTYDILVQLQTQIPADVHSALSLLPAGSLLPYAPPLGDV